MALAEEEIPPGEGTIVGQLLSGIIGRKGDGKRDAHIEATGLLKATFKVEDSLADELKVGLFANVGEKFPALIRFSNAVVSQDEQPDARGIGIKVFGVGGPKIDLDGSPDPGTQDFLLISIKEFLGANVAEFAKIAEKKAEQPSAHDFVAFLAGLNSRLPPILGAMLQTFGNTLEIDYHSTTPYLFGPGNAMKYRVRRKVEAGEDPLPQNPQDLKEALAKSVIDRSHVLEFLVQLQVDGFSIEDATLPWSESGSPFVKVAEIVIEPQDIDTPERVKVAEDVAITPWRTLEAHRPLGGINRARREIYLAVSQKRRDETGASQHEMTIDQFNDLV